MEASTLLIIGGIGYLIYTGYEKQQKQAAVLALKEKFQPAAPVYYGGETAPASGGPAASLPGSGGTTAPLIPGDDTTIVNDFPPAEPAADPATLVFAPAETGQIKADASQFQPPQGITDAERQLFYDYLDTWISQGKSAEDIQHIIDNWSSMAGQTGVWSAEWYAKSQAMDPTAAWWEQAKAYVYPVAVAFIPGAPTIDLSNVQIFYGQSIPANAEFLSDMTPGGMTNNIGRSWQLANLTEQDIADIRSIGIVI